MAKFPTMDELAKKVAEKAIDDVEYKGKTIREWIDMFATIEAYPVKHGRWEWNEDRCEWVCSKCFCPPVDGLPFDDPDYEPDMDYCPNCGAKMDLEEKKDDV